MMAMLRPFLLGCCVARIAGSRLTQGGSLKAIYERGDYADGGAAEGGVAAVPLYQEQTYRRDWLGRKRPLTQKQRRKKHEFDQYWADRAAGKPIKEEPPDEPEDPETAKVDERRAAVDDAWSAWASHPVAAKRPPGRAAETCPGCDWMMRGRVHTLVTVDTVSVGPAESGEP
jgi:hypothetical protein